MKIARHIAELMENRFELFGFKFGLDPIIGLFSGLGDLIPFIFGGYFIWIAIKIGLDSEKISQMVWNIILDFIVGVIPFFGDIFDFAFRSHTKNMKILEEGFQSKIIT